MNENITLELQRLAGLKDGILFPEDVVEAASNKKSVLHEYFEWDNSLAAKEYRIWQARKLIRVCVTYSPEVDKSYNVFVSLSSDRVGSGGYRQTSDVLMDEIFSKTLLDDALAELSLFKQKYHDLQELANVFVAIDSTVDSLKAPVPVVKKFAKGNKISLGRKATA